MYESPVNVFEDVKRICEDITKAKEEYIFSQIRAVVDVDKEELLKALQYDRQQYKKGYSDGMAARDAELVRCRDCKYHDDEEPGAVYCPDRVGGWVSEDFFCAGGERRE